MITTSVCCIIALTYICIIQTKREKKKKGGMPNFVNELYWTTRIKPISSYPGLDMYVVRAINMKRQVMHCM
jgi:hypothetical protein